MRILHMISPSSRMMKTYVDMVQEVFSHDEHLFMTTRDIPQSEQDFFADDNMTRMSGANRWEKMDHLKAECEKADVVVWHGFMYPFRLMLFLYGNRSILKKSVWVMWGIDLYNWKINSKSPAAAFKNHVNKYVRKHVAAVIALLEPDVEVFKKTIGGDAKIFVAPYPISMRSFSLMEERREAVRTENSRIRVQIGNNAHAFNAHFEVLKNIAHLDNPDMEYFLPVSYGDSKDWHGNTRTYITDLVEYVSDRYGDRAHCLTRMMQQDDYTEYLWGIDIAVFGAPRQNALGNMLKLLYMGSKVYLSPKNPLYGFFLSKGVQVGNADELAATTREEFLRPLPNDRAIEWIRSVYLPKNALMNWAPVFDMFRKAPEPLALEPQTGADIPVAGRFALRKNYLRVSPFVSNTRALPNPWRFVVIVGSGDAAASLSFAVATSEPFTFAFGLMVDTPEQMDAVGFGIGAVGLAEDAYLYNTSRYLVLPSYREGYRRKAFIEWFLEKTAAEQSDWSFAVKDLRDTDYHFVSRRAVFAGTCPVGFGSVVLGGANVQPGCTIGLGVLIEEAVLENNVTVGDYATICNGAVIGRNAVIGDGAVVSARAMVPEGAVVPNGTIVKPGQVFDGAALQVTDAAAAQALEEGAELPRWAQLDPEAYYARLDQVREINEHAYDARDKARRRDAYRYSNCDIDPDFHLTEDQLRQVREFWEPYEFACSNNPRQQEVFTAISGRFSPAYLGFGLQRYCLVKFWNSSSFSLIGDKNFTPVFFHDVKMPRTYLYNAFGSYFDEGRNLIATKDEAAEKLHGLLAEGTVKEFVIKPSDGGEGKGVRFVDGTTSLEELKGLFDDYGANFLCQEVLVNHPSFQAPYPGSLNTLRLVTVNWQDEIYFAGGTLRMGLDKRVDNWAQGGLACGVRADGELEPFAFDSEGRKTEAHPVTGFVFAGHKLYGYPEAVQLVKALHSQVPQQKYIAWDVTVNEAGEIVFIEINSPGGSETLQMSGHLAYVDETLTKAVLDEYLINRFFYNKAVLEWDYREFNDHVSLLKYQGHDHEVTVPWELRGKPVHTLYKGAIRGKEIDKISVPTTVHTYGEQSWSLVREGCRIELYTPPTAESDEADEAEPTV